MVGFDGFGKRGLVPEGVPEGVEDYEAGVDAGAEVGAVEVDGAAEERVAGGGYEEGWREPVQVSVDGREDGVSGIGCADVVGIVRAAIGRLETTAQAGEVEDGV